MPGQRSGNVTNRATAGAKPRQGNSRVLPEADRKIDARSQTQDSPRRTSGHAAQIRGSEHDHRRLKASPPPLHDHNLDSFQLGSWGEDAEPRVRRLTRDIRAKTGRRGSLWVPAEHWKLANHEPDRECVRNRAAQNGPIEDLPVEQDRARHGLQAGRSRPEKLAPTPRLQPVAKSRPRCEVQRRNRSRQTASSSCRLTPSVTKIRQ